MGWTRLRALLRSMRVFRRPLFWLIVFHVIIIVAYVSLESAHWIDALWWVTHPSAIPQTAQAATKIFSIFVFVGVFVFQIWFAERLLVILFSSEGKFLWGHINAVKASELREHYIVCGYGQAGQTLVGQMVKDGQPLAVIESDPQTCAELVQGGICVIQGNAREKDILLQAGIKRAKALCIVIDNEADNLFVIISARALNPKV